jgi:hypothetical protein
MNMMEVRFSLRMKDAIVDGDVVDFLELEWREQLTPRQLASRFHIWLNDQYFVERQLPDLQDAAYCQLSIDPLK